MTYGIRYSNSRITNIRYIKHSLLCCLLMFTNTSVTEDFRCVFHFVSPLLLKDTNVLVIQLSCHHQKINKFKCTGLIIFKLSTIKIQGTESHQPTGGRLFCHTPTYLFIICTYMYLKLS